MSRMWEAFENGEREARANMTEEQRELLARRPNQEAHKMAILMVIAKIARVATGVPHADNYDDMQGYTKIAKEHAIRPVAAPPTYPTGQVERDKMDPKYVPPQFKDLARKTGADIYNPIPKTER